MILDCITQPLYDTRNIVDGVFDTHFFVEPIGMGESCFRPGEAKTWADTNMNLAGALPAGFVFKITGIYAELVTAGRTPEQLAATTLQLYIGSKRWTEIPISMARLTMVIEKETAAAAAEAARALAGVASPLAPALIASVPGVVLGFKLNYPLVIDRLPFCMTLTPGAWFRCPTIVRLYLFGEMQRLVQ